MADRINWRDISATNAGQGAYRLSYSGEYIGLATFRVNGNWMIRPEKSQEWEDLMGTNTYGSSLRSIRGLVADFIQRRIVAERKRLQAKEDEGKPSLLDVPKMTQDGRYQVDVDWSYLPKCLANYIEQMKGSGASLDMDPEFQRAHRWTEEQQIAYVEWKLRGGPGADVIRFNCAGWMKDFRGPFVLVDGKQRLRAIERLLSNEIPVFGKLLNEYSMVEPALSRVSCQFHINDLKTMDEVYRWYLDLNGGGTPHTQEELDKVRVLLEKSDGGSSFSMAI